MVAAYPTPDRQPLQSGCDVGRILRYCQTQRIQYVSGHLPLCGLRLRVCHNAADEGRLAAHELAASCQLVA
jgi:hypothetical protein